MIRFDFMCLHILFYAYVLYVSSVCRIAISLYGGKNDDKNILFWNVIRIIPLYHSGICMTFLLSFSLLCCCFVFVFL